MKKNKKNSWKQISSQIVHKNPWYSIRKDEIVLPNGKKRKYYVYNTKNVSIIILMKNKKMVFVRQYRYPIREWTLELPKGGIIKGNTSLATAKKEMREETGYLSKNIKKIGSFSSIPGISSEICFVYLATNLVSVGQRLEESELEAGLKIVEIEIKKVYEMVNEGKFLDGQTIAALSLARNRLLTAFDKTHENRK